MGIIMTKLEAWLEDKKKHFENFGSLSEHDAKQAIAVIEKLKAALERSNNYHQQIILSKFEKNTEASARNGIDIVEQALAIAPEKL